MYDQNFHERFNISMELAGLSNILLARAINVDPSLISRYKTGKRVVRQSSDIAKSLASTLWYYIIKNGGSKSLSSYMKVRESALDEKLYSRWLFSDDLSDKDGANEAKKLLDVFDKYTKAAPLSAVPLDKESLMPLITDQRSYYKGEKGLQDGVVRFLGSIAFEYVSAKEILLFSDQNMRWMVGDKTFAGIWAALMGACIKKGVRIRIIHNINRGIPEMIQAIKSWLSLYMSGMVESYYLTVPEKTPFSHTFFINPDKYAISSWFTSGIENDAIYNYYTDLDHLSSIKSSFDKVLTKSEPLVYFPDSCDMDSSQLNFSYNNMLISIYEDSVIIKNELFPQKMFAFNHPLLLNAFRSFATTLCK